jgi:hypothetical protein
MEEKRKKKETTEKEETKVTELIDYLMYKYVDEKSCNGLST